SNDTSCFNRDERDIFRSSFEEKRWIRFGPVPSPLYSGERVRVRGFYGERSPAKPLTPALSPEYRGEGEALRRPHASKSISVVSETGIRQGRRLAGPRRGPAALRSKTPTAAAQHALIAGRRPMRIIRRPGGVALLAIAVVAPLGDVAIHVEQAP